MSGIVSSQILRLHRFLEDRLLAGSLNRAYPLVGTQLALVGQGQVLDQVHGINLELERLDVAPANVQSNSGIRLERVIHRQVGSHLENLLHAPSGACVIARFFLAVEIQQPTPHLERSRVIRQEGPPSILALLGPTLRSQPLGLLSQGIIQPCMLGRGIGCPLEGSQDAFVRACLHPPALLKRPSQKVVGVGTILRSLGNAGGLLKDIHRKIVSGTAIHFIGPRLRHRRSFP